MAKKRREEPGGGAPVPKVRVYARRSKSSQKHPKHPPASYFMVDKKPAHTPRKGTEWHQATSKEYSFQPGGHTFSSVNMPERYKRATRVAKNKKPKNYKRFGV